VHHHKIERKRAVNKKKPRNCPRNIYEKAMIDLQDLFLVLLAAFVSSLIAEGTKEE